MNNHIELINDIEWNNNIEWNNYIVLNYNIELNNLVELYNNAELNSMKASTFILQRLCHVCKMVHNCAIDCSVEVHYNFNITI